MARMSLVQQFCIHYHFMTGRATVGARISLIPQKLAGKTVLSQRAMIERLIIGPLTNGHLLIEGLPWPA
jgi:hypothetical protein